jgi:hypothetical protein
MSKHVAGSVATDLVLDYVNKAGRKGRMLKVHGATRDKFSADLFPQDCLRLVSVYEQVGDALLTLVSMHAKGEAAQVSDYWDYSEFKGHKLLVLKTGAEDQKGYSIGTSKAAKLAHAMTQYGVASVVASAAHVAGDAEARLEGFKPKAEPTKRVKGPAQTPKAPTHDPIKAAKTAAAKAAHTPKAAPPAKSTAQTHKVDHVAPMPTHVNPVAKMAAIQAERVALMRRIMELKEAESALLA